MAYFHTDDLQLHYAVHGQGSPVLMLHGGAASFEANYGAFGWVEALNAQGLQVIGMDVRGHGRSDKPTEVQAYGTVKLAGDVLALLDHLGLARASIVGYSLSTAVAAHLLQHAPHRLHKVALVATGDGLLGHGPHTFEQVLPLLKPALASVDYPHHLPKHWSRYWHLVKATQGDRAALQALVSASYPPLSEQAAAAAQTPTLVLSAANDVILGRGARLAETLGQGVYLEVPGADHFSLAAFPSARAAVADFLRAPSANAPPA